MQKLSLILILFICSFIFISGDDDSPHGLHFELNCDDCHTTAGWTVDRTKMLFSHDNTKFRLKGLHKEVDCKSCHATLIFNEAKSECMNCHTDIHQQTVGFDCARCHNSNSWVVNDIFSIHQQSRFSLYGAHRIVTCEECHQSASLLKFEPLNTECRNCHLDDFNSTTSPNHVAGSFSKECLDCHRINAFAWTGEGISHDFFPLTQGHEIYDCSKCHTNTGSYGHLSTDCYSCHQKDYVAATLIRHQALGLSTDCVDCHTTNPEWKPAKFDIHNSIYVLEGAHAAIAQDCFTCHEGNYTNIPNTCIGCHQADYNAVSDPSHTQANFSTDCTECHSQTAWTPATFDHSTFYVLVGAHAQIANNCLKCHEGGYTNTPNTCFGCHQTEYNQTSDPAHASAKFSTDCTLCHSQTAWEPSTFDHDNQYFPIYSGEHRGEWSTCTECHTNASNYSIYSCIDCHEHNKTDMDDEHKGEIGYVYNSINCFNCHPKGKADD